MVEIIKYFGRSYSKNGLVHFMSFKDSKPKVVVYEKNAEFEIRRGDEIEIEIFPKSEIAKKVLWVNRNDDKKNAELKPRG